MGKGWGKAFIWTCLIATSISAVFGALFWFGGPGFLAAAIVAVLGGATVIAWITEVMYRKSFPNLFRKFESHRRNSPGDADK